MIVPLQDCYLSFRYVNVPNPRTIKSNLLETHMLNFSWLLLRVIPACACVCWFYPLAKIPAMEHPRFVRWFYSWTLGSARQKYQRVDQMCNPHKVQYPFLTFSHRVPKDLTRIHITSQAQIQRPAGEFGPWEGSPIMNSCHTDWVNLIEWLVHGGQRREFGTYLLECHVPLKMTKQEGVVDKGAVWRPGSSAETGPRWVECQFLQVSQDGLQLFVSISFESCM